MLDRFKSHISTFFPEMLDSPFLLACSGGIDSVVLWHLCAETGLQFEVAHCNFNLRGSESEEDAEFVVQLSHKYNNKIHVTSFDTETYRSENKLSVQEAARQLRYTWFAKLLTENGLNFTATAHHLDDQIETFLINLSRGSGLDGLGGIPERTPLVRRPFLVYSRSDILAYAMEMGLTWREDSSNMEDKYFRNRLRAGVVPALRDADPRFEQGFANSLRYLRGSRALVKNHIEELRAELFHQEGDTIRISLTGLRKLHPLEAYLHELFRPYGFTDWDGVARLLEGHSGKEVQSKSHRLLRDRNDVLLKNQSVTDSEIYQVDLSSPSLTHPISLQIQEIETMGTPSRNVLYVDKETLKEGLTLRKWRKGDYFYPLGMHGRQKVSKYFKDHKFSTFQKESQWLLCCGDAIVWIVGHRADDRFKVTDGTTQIVRIEWIK